MCVLLADSTVRGSEARTPSAALRDPASGGSRQPQRIPAVRPCSRGAKETLPGAAGKWHPFTNLLLTLTPDSRQVGVLRIRTLNSVFQARNRHNLEQSSKLAQNKELLNKRNAQVTVMDQRICDLRERLHKKRAEVGRFPVIFVFWYTNNPRLNSSFCSSSWVGWTVEAPPPLRRLPTPAVFQAG